jgi:hypothetical protein
MATTSDDRLTAAKTNDSGAPEFGRHVVALIDFLGQSSELAKWDYEPDTPQRMEKWIPAVRSSMGRVLRWREEFETMFRQRKAESDRYMEQASVGQPAELRRQLDEYRKTALRTAHFTDSLIFCYPLQNEHGYRQVGNVADLIGTLGIVMLAALSRKTAFRGAIEVGMLGYFPTGDPYGPALSKAHHLEAKDADYPRILVGPQLLSYLKDNLENTDADMAARANLALAKMCQECIVQDTDGHWIVDYLNDEFASHIKDRSVVRQVRSQALAFVQAEHDRFAQEGKDELAMRLTARYERLLAYFRSRGVS